MMGFFAKREHLPRLLAAALLVLGAGVAFMLAG